LQAFFDQFTGEEVISTQQVVVAGDWAFDRGNLTITGQLAAGGEPFQYSGNILLIWQRQPDGSWLIAVDIWNSDLPAATEEGTEAET
jgi:ketosteroid isomerase-like protein